MFSLISFPKVSFHQVWLTSLSVSDGSLFIFASTFENCPLIYLRSRSLMFSEVTPGQGFKAKKSLVKNNKYCHHQIKVKVTDAREYFFPFCVISFPLSKEGKSEEVQLKETGRKSLSPRSFITISCVVTPADIQIDLPSCEDSSAFAQKFPIPKIHLCS